MFDDAYGRITFIRYKRKRNDSTAITCEYADQINNKFGTIDEGTLPLTPYLQGVCTVCVTVPFGFWQEY